MTIAMTTAGSSVTGWEVLRSNGGLKDLKDTCLGGLHRMVPSAGLGSSSPLAKPCCPPDLSPSCLCSLLVHTGSCLCLRFPLQLRILLLLLHPTCSCPVNQQVEVMESRRQDQAHCPSHTWEPWKDRCGHCLGDHWSWHPVCSFPRSTNLFQYRKLSPRL